MKTPDISRRGHRLLQAGILLFLAALIVGFAVPRFSVPRLGLSAHLLGIMQGIFLLVCGMLWPRLRLNKAMSRAGAWLAIYGCIAAWTSNVLAAAWGAGSGMLPLAAGAAHGSPAQELIIAIGLRTAAASLVVATLIVI